MNTARAITTKAILIHSQRRAVCAARSFCGDFVPALVS
jgi:hypothetical protein